jgi:uncharacterized protein (TIGR03086 family)
MDLVALHRRGVSHFHQHVQSVREDQWHMPTPCTDWEVRDLVNHLVAEARWVPDLMAGSTVAEVGDRYDGDQLGADPQGAWADASAAALEAVAADGALDRIVHVSWGDIPAEVYVSQLTCDLVVHGWDLARAIAADESIDSELVDYCYRWSVPQAELMRSSGLFGEQIEPAADADDQTRLLNLFGRRP